MTKVFISTAPFGQIDKTPLDLLKNSNVDFLINPLGRKLTETELSEMISDTEVLIAGTEAITESVLAQAKKLKLICRVGIGLDSVDLVAAKKLGVLVSYTPDAPAPAVAELTLGLMMSLIRKTHIANKCMHQGEWNRFFGRRMSSITVGIIGLGRIGGLVLDYVDALGFGKILINDLKDIQSKLCSPKVHLSSKEEIYHNADLITVHLPLNSITKNLISENQLKSMKRDGMLINTSRGGIINELDLISTLKDGHFSGIALDVFSKEPYDGGLKNFDRCILTSHMGSMTLDCRAQMEIEATQEAIRYISGESLLQLVPVAEYEEQERASDK
jgi:D-3-phosphoglycerate dehydrogenase / 2-oxoglutarate reductase